MISSVYATIDRTRDRMRFYDIVILASLLWFMIQFFRFSFPPLFDTFQTEFGVSNTATGLLFSVLMLCYSISQFPTGVLSDSYGKIEVITISMVGLSIGALLVVISPTFVLITVAAGVIGAMSGAHKTIAVPLLSNQYKTQTGFALGLFETIGQLGGAVAPLVVIALFALILPWQTIFVLSATVCLVLSWLFYRRVRQKMTAQPSEYAAGDEPVESVDERIESSDAEAATEPSQSMIHQYVGAMRNTRLVIFVLATIGFTFTWNGVSSFLPLFLLTEGNLSATLAGVVYSLVFVTSFGQIVTGDLSDRVGRVPLSLVLVVIVIAAITILLVFDGFVILIVATIMLGIGLHGFRPVRDAYFVELMPADIEAGLFGFLRMIKTSVGAIAPIFVGYVSDVANFTYAFGGLLFMSVFSFVCLTVLLVGSSTMSADEQTA